MRHTYDALIIGAGQAGSPLAGRLTAAGMKVALIERKLFGAMTVAPSIAEVRGQSLGAQTRLANAVIV